MKVEISLGFAFLFSGIYFFDDSGLFAAISLGIFFHELGHYLAIRLLGGRVYLLRFQAVGLSMVYSDGAMSYGRDFVVALAGPICSLILAFSASLIGKHGAIEYADYVAGISFIFFVFNMMPVRQLDGGKALSAFFSLFLKAEPAERILDWVSLFAICLLLLFGIFVLVVSKRNFTLLLAALWLLAAFCRENGRMGRRGRKIS